MGPSVPLAAPRRCGAGLGSCSANRRSRPPAPSFTSVPSSEMSERELPSVDEARKLLPGPDSMTWRYAGDIRVLAAAGYALLLQVAHPTVAAGVREHSNYADDPWGRLLRTLDHTNLVLYGGPEAAVAAARELRRRHERIRGTTPEG